MATAQIDLRPVESPVVLKAKVYDALKEAIISMDIYSEAEPPKLDERQLAVQLGVSRTPVREALIRLEQEGFVRTMPRRGAYVERKTKREIIEMIQVWAVVEGLAARLIIERATDKEIASLRKMFATFENGQLRAHIDEYSEANVAFHQKLISMSQSELIMNITNNLFLHVRSIRRRTIAERDRVERSIVDHMRIIEALEKRNTSEAERLVRNHTLNLAKHIDKYVTYLG